jgi:hypothetical protein
LHTCTLALAFLFSFTLAQGNAQGNSNRDFWSKITERELNMDLKQQKKWDKMKSDSLYTSVESVKFNKITSFIKGGKLHFKNPKEAETLVAIPKSVKAKSSDEFTWAGVFEENRGDITVIAQDGDIFGRFNIDGEVYEIHDLGKKKNVMVKIKPFKTPMCSATNRNAMDEPNQTESLASSQMLPPPPTCDNNNVRVLVFYTTRTAESFNPTNIAALAVNQLNTSTINSGITQAQLSFTLAGVVPLPVIEKRSIFDTYSDFKTLTDNQLLRLQYGADIAVLLTNISFDEGIKGVAITGASMVNGVVDLNGGWRCIVDAGIATSSYVFAHEVGHLFYCSHEDPQPAFLIAAGFPADKRAKTFTTTSCHRCWWGFGSCCNTLDRQTIMTGLASTNTIPHFSNPAINFQGVSTGEVGVRNNARILKETACQVANYLPYTVPFSVTISGSTYCNGYDTYTWSANTANCPANISSVNWEFSTNGIDYSPFSTGSPLVTSLPLDPQYDGYVYLRVTATCSNNTTATDYIQIYVYSSNSPYLKGNDNEGNNKQNQIKSDYDNVLIAPNPTSDKVQVSLRTEASSTLTVSLQDLTGKTLKSIQNKDVNEGIMQFEFDVKSYPNGIYLIHIQSDGKTVTRKLTIQK